MRRIVCFGDSITRAAEFPEQHRWPRLLKLALEKRLGDTCQIYNRGVNGNTTAQGFDRIEADLQGLLPAVVLVQFGFNDANVRDWALVPRVSLEEYRRNLREFHRYIHAGGGCCVFIVNHPVVNVGGVQGNGRSYEDNFAPYNEAVRELAKELGAPAVDLPRQMQERGIRPEQMLGSDGMHLSVAGNRSYAAMVADVLVPLLEAQHPQGDPTPSSSMASA